MSFELRSARFLARDALERAVQPGDSVVDATMGNGHDTLFLAEQVGPEGHVYAFDIQEEALTSTRAHLVSLGCPENYTLIHASHHRILEFVKESPKAVMFNLGYLPGSGKKQVTTLRETTMGAVRDALSILSGDGILLVAIYPGHEEGRLEGEMLGEYFATLDRRLICCSCFKIVNSPTSPYFYVVEKK